MRPRRTRLRAFPWACSAYIKANQLSILDARQKIAFDKLHMLKALDEMVDKVRCQEHKALFREGSKRSWLTNLANDPQIEVRLCHVADH